ncbi:MAG: ABC transporter substrate-binding protein [Candidatus Electryonea clarkiae]|nr:ABC transporter substrate-binding protein [Candidatus Electryonea clarkiae]MDP8287518.1 ABC transporter substrate-binding protein [Candidatus Electryonea clarkiae]
MNNKFAILVFLLVASLCLFSACSEDDDSGTTTVPTITEISIAALVAQTGFFSDQADAYIAALNLAVEDVNADFDARGLNFEVDLTYSDTKTDPDVASTLLNAYLDQDFRFVVGPMTSDEVSKLKDDVDLSQSILISPSSSLIDLAVADDNIYRLVTDDSKMAEAMVKAMMSKGISNLAILHYDNYWGHSVAELMRSEFEAQGGTIIDTFAFYGGRSSEITEVLDSLSVSINDFLTTGDPATAAIQMISYDTGSIVLEIASSDTTLGKVKWFGCDGYVNNTALFDTSYEAGADFAALVEFTSPVFGVESTTNYQALYDRIQAVTGSTPGVYAMLHYDAFVASANALQSAGEDADLSVLKDALVQALSDIPGVTGNITLNDAGDRANGKYFFWTVMENRGSYEWVHSMTYSDGTITEE